MKFADYATACIPDPTNILFLQLRPLSVGHYLLGKRFGCGFFSDTAAQVGIDDLLLGVVICSMEYREFLDFMADPKASRKAIAAWSKQALKASKRNPLFNILVELKRFQKYIEDGSKMPLFNYEQEPKASGTHWSMGLLNTLMGKLGYSRDEALNMPLTQAFSEYVKYAESEGAVTILDDFEEELVTGQFDWGKYFEQLKQERINNVATPG